MPFVSTSPTQVRTLWNVPRLLCEPGAILLQDQRATIYLLCGREDSSRYFRLGGEEVILVYMALCGSPQHFDLYKRWTREHLAPNEERAAEATIANRTKASALAMVRFQGCLATRVTVPAQISSFYGKGGPVFMGLQKANTRFRTSHTSKMTKLL